MVDLIATTPGLYPLPDWAKGELSGLKGHQKHDLIDGSESPDIVTVYDTVREELIEDQKDAGLDRHVEGQARWDDMLVHPLVVQENVETGGIVRYYNNNNFYRDPVVVGDLSPTGDIGDELERASSETDHLQAVLPGPYSLADLATDEYYGDDAEFLDSIADLLIGEIAEFPDHDTLFLLEPSLVANPPADGADAHVSEVIDRVSGATDAEVIVHTYWGALTEKVHAHLLDADVDAVGYDFVSDVDANLYNISEYGTKENIALGLVDGQNTLVESPDTVVERVAWIQDRLPATQFERIYLTANTEMFYLPVNKYQSKLETLGDAVRLSDEGQEVTA